MLQIGRFLRTLAPNTAWTRDEANMIRKKVYQLFLWSGSI